MGARMAANVLKSGRRLTVVDVNAAAVDERDRYMFAILPLELYIEIVGIVRRPNIERDAATLTGNRSFLGKVFALFEHIEGVERLRNGKGAHRQGAAFQFASRAGWNCWSKCSGPRSSNFGPSSSALTPPATAKRSSSTQI